MTGSYQYETQTMESREPKTKSKTKSKREVNKRGEKTESQLEVSGIVFIEKVHLSFL